jgi:acetyltransferase-like isoleucine patch superfamily enzyme
VSRTLARIRNNLRRPLPDLAAWLWAKVLSAGWRPSLKQVGRGFHVGAGASFRGGSRISIGAGFNADRLLWVEAVTSYLAFRFEPDIEIGDGVICSQSVHITATNCVTIRDGVLLGSHVHITDHAHGTYHGAEQDSPDVPPQLRRPSTGRPVTIEPNVWLGDGVVVLPGVTIGRGTIVGANSVVSRSLPAGVIAVGSPAVPIRRYDEASGQWLPIAGAP